MNAYVVDASVAAKWFLPEDHSAKALRVLESSMELHAPDILLAEIDNALCKRFKYGDLDQRKAKRARRILRNLPIELHPFLNDLDTAFGIAIDHRCGVNDCIYVALAASLEAKMVTADRRLYDELAGTPLAPHLLWIEDVP